MDLDDVDQEAVDQQPQRGQPEEARCPVAFTGRLRIRGTCPLSIVQAPFFLAFYENLSVLFLFSVFTSLFRVY